MDVTSDQPFTFPLLRHNLDLTLPKSPLHVCGVEYSHLAVILACRKLIETDAEAERHRSQSVIRRRRHRHGLCFEYLRLTLIEAHKGNKWLSRCSGGLVSLKIDIQ